ncbi:hypothetical protein D9C73_011884 [Collichthys lucidus]|uniref:C1q domain-containing protein n=1 Tax=Collichthys lucidus TaxID=240159 RepID=A0A4U5URS8_COLLU|nr:hypothetical protein D9C73_011884 [Collichthys lucidus]
MKHLYSVCLGEGRSKGGVGMECDERGRRRMGRGGEKRGGEGGVTDTLVFDSSGGHHLRGKRALMGILSSRQAQASAPSSPAAINRGKAQEHSRDNDILLQGVENKAEKGEQELERQTDILAELIALREMVVEQSVELRHLTARVTAAENLVEKLQMENSGMEARMTTTENLVERLQMENSAMEARMTAAESMAEELQMENDAQATELTVTQEKLSSLQQRVTVTENRVAWLERQQEVRKLAFSVSLLASGEGNTEKEDVQLIYRNIFTNTGNHYNANTGYFTAPVKGIYYFRFTGHIAHSDLSMRMGLFKNSDLIVTSVCLIDFNMGFLNGLSSDLFPQELMTQNDFKDA